MLFACNTFSLFPVTSDLIWFIHFGFLWYLCSVFSPALVPIHSRSLQANNAVILRQAALCCLMIASAPERRERKQWWGWRTVNVGSWDIELFSSYIWAAVFTCEHLMYSRRHVHLCQALPALSVVQPDQRTALQRQPHTLTVRHHARHAPTAVCAHLEPVLRRREEVSLNGLSALLFIHISIHPSTYLLYQCSCVDNKDSVLWATP